jgi:hypothetical protein
MKNIESRLAGLESAAARFPPPQPPEPELDCNRLPSRRRQEFFDLLEKLCRMGIDGLAVDEFDRLSVLGAIARGDVEPPGEFYFLAEVSEMLGVPWRRVEHTKYAVVTVAEGEIEPAIKPLEIARADVYAPEIIERIRARLSRTGNSSNLTAGIDQQGMNVWQSNLATT